MKMFLISDNKDTQVGMRLAGVDGVLISPQSNFKQVLEDVLKDKEIGVLLITEKLCKMAPEEIKEIKMNKRTPLIVEVPDKRGTERAPDFINAYIRDAIGLKI